MKTLFLAAALAATASAAPAMAATFLLSFSGPLASSAPGVSGSLTLTTSDALNADGSVTVTDATGTVNWLFDNTSDSVTGLTSYNGSNQHLFPAGNSKSGGDFDQLGLSVMLTNSRKLNLYYSQSAYRYFSTRANGTVTSFTLTPAVTSAVPEPASWVMMIAGFGLAGALLRRRARPAVTFA